MLRLRFCSLLLCLCPLARSEAVPDPNRGLYAIWSRPEISDRLPFLKGGQVVLQWEAVEPAAGRYDFSDLHRQLEAIAKLGGGATVQLNANRQPQFLVNPGRRTSAGRSNIGTRLT